MAYYAAIVSLVQLLDDILHHNRNPDISITKREILKSLHIKFSFLEESLQDYSSKGHEANDCVEEQIRDVAYRAQDIIEFEILNQIHSKKGAHATENTSQHGSVPVVQTYQEERLHVKKYAEDLQMVQDEVDFIVQELMTIKETQRIEGLKLQCDSCDDIGAFEQASTSGNTMVGFDEDLTTIKDKLCGQSSQLHVISIVGMGGIGKTTLARKTFHDTLVVYHFHCRVWVTISQDYRSIRVLQSIRNSTGNSTGLMINEPLELDEGALKDEIYKYLKGRRYLIIMDDIWNMQVWDDVKQIFPNDCNGSRIMITTRLLDVAQYVGTSNFLHEMQFLNKDQSWKLLQNKVFGQQHCPPILIHTGELIASKCHGLPLAIVLVAGILSNVKTTSHEWKKIARDAIAFISTKDEHLCSVLSLSYNHLPHQLKACFLYMGVFPEDYKIKVSKLIKLWIAEGFLKSTSKSKSLENAAEKCLEDLVKRNLVLVIKKRANGQFKVCILHDVLREFCRQRAFYDGFFHAMHETRHLHPQGVKNVRRVNIDFNSYHLSWCNLYDIGNVVRSILCFGERFGSMLNVVEPDSVKLLKVLDTSTVTRTNIDLISQMSDLKHLAFHLDINQRIHQLPQFILTVRNLQTLIIHTSRCHSITLPLQIWKMTQLRHLIIDTMVLPPIPIVDNIPVQKLGCLQTLMKTIDFIFTDEVITMIPNLRKLKIEWSINKPHCIWELYCLRNLVDLTQLEELKMEFWVFKHVPFVNCPCNLAFPRNLTKLTLRGCRVQWKDLTKLGSLPNLQVLRLRDNSFVGKEWKPIEGEFQCLKFLLLEWLNLRYWHAENSHFPCLEHLKIRYCRNLKDIPLEIGDIPTLKFIDVFASNNGAGDSAILIQDEQKNLGNDVLQVRVRR